MIHLQPSPVQSSPVRSSPGLESFKKLESMKLQAQSILIDCGAGKPQLEQE